MQVERDTWIPSALEESRNRSVTDVSVAAAVALTALPAWSLGVPYLLVAILVVIGCALRSRIGDAWIVLVTAGLFLHATVTTGFTLLFLAGSAVAAYGVGRLRRAGVGAAFMASTLVLGLLVGDRMKPSLGESSINVVAVVVLSFLWTLVFLLAGTIRSHGVWEREQREAARERRAQEDLRLAQLAELRQRHEVARELHDWVSGNLAVIVAQADGAQVTLETDPGRSAEAIRCVSRTGREAMDQMRGLMRTLRGDEDGSGRSSRPHPTLADLDALLTSTRNAGVDVTLNREGRTDDLPPLTSHTAYRIIQESLTNSIKHKGQGTRVTVKVTRTSGKIRVGVSDEGAPRAPEKRVNTGGLGLTGMRERLLAVGGDMHVSSTPETWSVEAHIPLAPGVAK